MTIIIRDVLINPPTWFASFRDLTLFCNVFLKKDVVIESDDADTYNRYIRPRGGMDFVEDFVRPGSEDGLRIDIDFRFATPTIITDRIAPENIHNLIGRIRGRC